jgi:acetylornithine deacetylase/succinyl-diaminopimelate desuccinylase-like protein
MNIARPITYARHQRSRFVEELKAFIRFPSISAQPRRAGEVKKCAIWLASPLQRIGMENVKVVPTARHPLVYADWLRQPRGRTVLIYGHYDVQPVDPLTQWRSPPFAPIVRGNNLYGRGASDDKGQLFAHLKAMESYLRTTGELPANVKCLFEGEEEIGSTSLAPFWERHRRAFAADVAVLSDMPILAPNRPAITYAMRGALSLELEVHGPKQDLHSGNFGGAVHNPLEALCSHELCCQPGFHRSPTSRDARRRHCLSQSIRYAACISTVRQNDSGDSHFSKCARHPDGSDGLCFGR